MSANQRNPDAAALYSQIKELRTFVAQEGDVIFNAWRPRLTQRSFCISAHNLANYLALRRRDLRELQRGLTTLGLSSLGRSEARVLPNIDAVLSLLGNFVHDADAPPMPPLRAMRRGERLLAQHTRALLGDKPVGRDARIMVTMPTEAADDPALVQELVNNGMDCARINCAHDDAAVWSRIAGHVRDAGKQAGRPIKILMDLGGPKVRTEDVVFPKKTRIKPGDILLLRRDVQPQDEQVFPFQVRCSLPAVIDQLTLNKRVSIDDGVVTTVVEALLPAGAVLRVQRVKEGEYKLKNEKGLNFPDTDLRLTALTDEDLQALDTVVEQADMVGFSFVQTGRDIAHLQAELAKRMKDPSRMAIIAKIETPRAVRNLPEIIVRAAGKQPFGVMIARGDLAVELGFVRTAEMQEQILWLCEAAHVPVIWATQVLESFVKDGMPSRGEMTDAAMAARAECVMLNKGPYIADAITMIDDLLRRMREHQNKKSPQMRALRSWLQRTGDD